LTEWFQNPGKNSGIITLSLKADRSWTSINPELSAVYFPRAKRELRTWNAEET
jgi:hypothetical protein